MHDLALVYENKENKDVIIRSESKLVFVCGEGSITITPDGKITLKGTSIHEVADTLNIEAKRVDVAAT